MGNKRVKQREKPSKKKVIQAEEISPKEAKSVVDARAYLNSKPVWKFKRIDHTHEKWNFNNCSDMGSTLKKLADFESMTWNDIQVNAKKNNHFINVSDMIKEAGQRLDYLGIVEDQLFSLRITGKMRIFGILRTGEFEVLWLDCDHEICPSKKKHT
ncbi:hypothetical protein IGI66_001724 [Enterococcus sp. AZ048]|uniref:hypothetical protein n=1 Tax=Enterococcus sp. AZ048 TaxID=2774658 RepID=UPI003F26678A